jgi:hypothetical protein
MRSFVMFMVVFSLAVIPAWAQPGTVNTNNMKDMSFHGPVSPAPGAPGDEPGLSGVLKHSKLTAYPSKTIGEAFDGYRYFVKREWRETRSSGGRIYVDFTGWFKTGVFDANALQNRISMRGIGIKFIVHPDGRYGAVMASRVEIKTDGKLYSQPIDNLNDILKNIYANKEIRL